MRAVLTFHSVDESGSVLSIAPQSLRSLVRCIRESGHAIVPLLDLLEEPAAPNRIALTFDDGVASVPAAALPVLEQEEAPATLFVTTGYLGRQNDWPSMPADAPRMKMAEWDGIEALHRAGWAIEGHTETHPDLRDLDSEQIEAEIEASNGEIEKRLGRAPRVFAYPYGYFDDRVVEHAAAHHSFSVTAQMGTLEKGAIDPHRIPRLETYYFRDPFFHRGFGGALFRSYLAGRTVLRNLRAA